MENEPLPKKRRHSDEDELSDVELSFPSDDGNKTKLDRRPLSKNGAIRSFKPASGSGLSTPSHGGNKKKGQRTPLSKNGAITSFKPATVISKEAFFMSIAVLAAQRSKDPCLQVGACLVDANEKNILGVGYNGAPDNVDDNDFPWSETYEGSKVKNDFVIHAEANALSLSDRTKHKGSIMFCTHYPCKECAKTMLHYGVKKVYYLDDSRKAEVSYDASVRLLKYAEEKGTMMNYKMTNFDIADIKVVPQITYIQKESSNVTTA